MKILNHFKQPQLLLKMTPTFNFHNKTFTLLKNSNNGEVSQQTIFKYQQNGDLVTADYFGGSIRYGKIIALLKTKHLHMIYQCLTKENELKTGKAIAEISTEANGKIKLHLHWEWLDPDKEKGTSVYIEK